MEREYFELTNPQKSIWLTDQMYPDTSIENIGGYITIEDKLNIVALKKSINRFIEKNDSFRFKFDNTSSGIRQYVSTFVPFDIEVIKVNSDNEVKCITKNIVSTPFDLTNSLLFNFKIFEYPNGHGGFIINAHHIISDAWTAGLLINEIIDNYAFFVNAQETIEEQFPSYIDYIETEKEYLQSERFKKDEAFWLELYKFVPEVAKIPSTKEISSKQSFEAIRKQFNMPKEVIEQIKQYCSSSRTSIYNFFMAIYSIYLNRISGLNEFAIGTPILNRSTFKEKHATGMFISTIPFKVSIEDAYNFSNFTATIAKDTLSMFRHQKYPYTYLLEQLRKENSSIPNLYDILISYQNVRTDTQSSQIAYNTIWAFNGYISDGMNIHIYDLNDTGSLDIAYDYLISRYDEEDIEMFHKRILHIIEQVLENPNILLNNIEIVTPEEKQKLIYDFNNTKIEYDENKTISMLFEEQVKKTPDAIAMVFENQKMTYKQLNEKANSLAYYLRSVGVTNNSVVGVMLNRSFEMIIAILAILKAGGAYIPIDPEYPAERISYMLENSKSKFLLSSNTLKENNINVENQLLVDLNSTIYENNKENLENISTPDDLSYLIYTSGSTGNPKGVMLTQKNLSNFCASMYDKIEYLKDNKTYSIVSMTTVSFDIFGFETLVSLTRGLTLFMTNYFEQKITNKLERLIMDNNIDILQTTPSTMKYHLDNLASTKNLSKLKYVMLAGEQLPKSLVSRIKEIAPNCKVYNGYGPSETTIFSTVEDVTNLEEITIGRPIGNTQIYLLDKTRNLVPINAVGEIYIAGDGVGKGYHNNIELTTQSFLDNPFGNTSKLYKTGDLGIWLPNGVIKCLGRVDNQIKLRGLRIEIGEIEEIINSFDTSKKLKSAVLVKNENGNSSLHAFYSSPTEIAIEELKSYMKSHLPNYMIPNTFTKIDEIPYTPNGKINRKALNFIKIDNTDVKAENVISPRNELDSLLLNTVKNKLNVTDIGIDQNIFDYGADSLIIINMLTELFQYNLGIKVNDFYQFPTVRQLSNHISSRGNSDTEISVDNLLKINDVVASLDTSVNPTATTEQKSILLTGCTGFLGAHLLAELLNSPEKISSIYCLVRSKNHLEPRKRLYDMMNFYFGSKYNSLLEKYVTVIESDISVPNLGINDVALKLLKENINCVIHCAANVKHYGKYSDFEKVNIVGTRNVIEFCLNQNAELHYISTMTVSGNYLLEQEDIDTIFNESKFYDNQNFDENVYAKSKLLAEGYVLSSISKGLTATIYRIGDLSGRYTDGVFQKNIDENSIYLRLKSILEIGAISSSLKELELEFTPVDYAATAIAKIMWSSNSKNRIFHIYNQNKITTEFLINILKDYREIKFLSPKDFKDYIKKLSANNISRTKLNGIINDFTNESDLIYSHTIKVDNSITTNYLKALDFTWPTLTKEYFNILLTYMKDVNFIN